MSTEKIASSQMPELILTEYSVYARPDENNRVSYIFSNKFEKPLETDVLIKSGYTDEYIHVGYYKIVDDNGAHLYKIEDGTFMECTEEDIEEELREIRGDDNYSAEVSELESISGGKLATAGWYRIAKYNGGEGSAYANSCEIVIKRVFENTENEYHNLRLVSVTSLHEFQPISCTSNIQLIDKIRYTYDSENGYLEMYYRGNTSEPIYISIIGAKDYNYRWVAIIPESTTEEVNGVTVVTSYNIPANIKLLTNMDTIGNAEKLNGYSSDKFAMLDNNGKVPSSILPAFVDDVLEYATKEKFPATGESGKIYMDLNSNKTYRWSGSAYVEISPSIALGETSATAYRGDRGKIAYEHSQAAHAPSDAEKNQNAFSKVIVGSTTISSGAATDGFTLEAGSNVTLTPDASGKKVTIAAKNATYNAMTGASSSAAGKAGLVPAPAAGEQASFLRGDGTWASVDAIKKSSTAPSDTNVLWLDTSTGLIKYHNGTSWVATKSTWG